MGVGGARDKKKSYPLTACRRCRPSHRPPSRPTAVLLLQLRCVTWQREFIHVVGVHRDKTRAPSRAPIHQPVDNGRSRGLQQYDWQPEKRSLASHPIIAIKHNPCTLFPECRRHPKVCSDCPLLGSGIDQVRNRGAPTSSRRATETDDWSRLSSREERGGRSLRSASERRRTRITPHLQEQPVRGSRSGIVALADF